MSENTNQGLSGVAETLLMTLYIRALESRRPGGLIKDERAEALIRRMDSESIRRTAALTKDSGRAVIILKGREFDRIARDFMARHPDAAVVHIGCGFDTRFERVVERNGQAEWYELDLPHVIDLRRKLVGDEAGRHHLLSCSVLDNEWLDRVSVHRRRPFLFLAEGVFMYFTEAQVKRLVLALRDRFPGAELIFDAYSPIHVWRHNLQFSLSKVKFPTHWGIWHGQEIEGWGDDIRLLGEWGPFDEKTPRLNRIQWLRGIEAAARTFRIYRFQLGKAAG